MTRIAPLVLACLTACENVEWGKLPTQDTAVPETEPVRTLVVLTADAHTAAEARLGDGAAAIVAEDRISVINDALARSGLALEFEVAGVEVSEATEQELLDEICCDSSRTEAEQLHHALRRRTDTPASRRAAEADIVVLLSTLAEGHVRVPEGNIQWDYRWGYATSPIDDDDEWVQILGTLMWAGPEAGHPDAVDPDFRKAHVDCSASVSTAMYEGSGCTGTQQLLVFSSPHLDWNGAPLGVEEEADNVCAVAFKGPYLDSYHETCAQWYQCNKDTIWNVLPQDCPYWGGGS